MTFEAIISRTCWDVVQFSGARDDNNQPFETHLCGRSSEGFLLGKATDQVKEEVEPKPEVSEAVAPKLGGFNMV